jgi:hypothetical protein
VGVFVCDLGGQLTYWRQGWHYLQLLPSGWGCGVPRRVWVLKGLSVSAGFAGLSVYGLGFNQGFRV